MKVEIRQLKEGGKTFVLNFIAGNHLRPEGILEKGTRYWGAFVDNRLAGVIGCEYKNQYGLLRSALVIPTDLILDTINLKLFHLLNV